MMDDLQTCEHCGKSTDIEECHRHEDVWLCDSCDKEWREHFKKCDHNWTPHVNEMGEDGQYCTRCAGFVCDEDFPLLFGKSAPSAGKCREILEEAKGAGG